MSAGWGDRFRGAADLALFGAVVTVAALPVVTAGAAFSAGSYAMAHFVSDDMWPSPRSCAEFGQMPSAITTPRFSPANSLA